ncbi:unnamed protein product [Lactuca saligna]|uniref:Leucine-rich repeat-containing N-terminal plant-type domain-containing protein n=1 Tax=Lactuca saligna TaxID=75948 RepID=A0AA35ZDY3_LACSI|nr:unnamed protein product [Lactuca saligna]
MHPCVLIIFLLFLLRLQNTTTNQLVVDEGVGGGYDDGVVNKCLDKERDALLQFKGNLQDPNGSLSTWRPEDDDCCAWEGVICDDQTGHHVTGLHIPSAGLVGEISHSLVNLTYLNLLDLSSNSFHGTIPPEFGNLTNLKVLNLRDVGSCRVENLDWLSHLSLLEALEIEGISLAKANQWVNVILNLPKLSDLRLDGCELSQVMYPYSSSFLNSSSSISFLSLRNNNLTSSMYHWMFSLTSNSLHILDLSSNMLDGIPKYLGNLCSLESFHFNNNRAVVKFPDFLNNLSGCTSLTLQQLSAETSQFTGSFPDDIQNFSSLEGLYLSNNHINGTISERFWELPLQAFDVSQNHLSGAISENIGKSKASIINLSKNPLQGVPSTDHMSNQSSVTYIDLNSCKLGPHFPKWIQMLKKLNELDISNTSISDTVPPEFWNIHLSSLNLSSNNISGEVPDLSSSFFGAQMIDLSSNSFIGPIPHLPSGLQLLNLSRNKFSGGISFLCQMVDGLLKFLDLSHNTLTGQLPDCLWHFQHLTVLNLGHNSLSGRLPPSIGSLIELEALYLYKNNFFGELPLSLKNCTSLTSLNLGANKFSGNVPVWFGENLSELYVLILRSNNFFGTIPSELCQLANLQILDFSRNNLHGSIPSCLNNLTKMAQVGFLPPPNVHPYTSQWHWDLIDEVYIDHAMIEWQGDEREFFRNLGLLKSIDLSSNNLTGHIPHELTNLHELLALNLSKNALIGEIPQQLGEMKNLLALDLSRNSLSGGIPSSMSQMTSLCYLDVSYNKLSGRIPSSTQLQSFEPSRYDGNTELCGLPLPKKCPGDEESQVGKSEGDEEDIDEDWGWFCIGGGTGFVTGFWIACGALLLNRRGRRAFFNFYDSFRDWVYVKVMVFIAKLRRIANM